MNFGLSRADPPTLHMGWEMVAVGPEHRIGKVDPSIAIVSAQERGGRSGLSETNGLQQTDAKIAEFVERELRPAIRRTSPHGRAQVLLYIHGYRTTFEEAVRNTAQLAADLNFVSCDGKQRGIAICYSWPAQNTVLGYLSDEENAEWTQQRLAPFVQALSRMCQRERADLTLMAHSMGARALVRSLADLANSCSQDRRGVRLANHVILLAPDIGKGLFDQYVDRFLPLVHHLTIYVSSRDRALGLSTFLHGGHGRLGLIETTVLAAMQITGLHHEDHRELGYVAAQPGNAKIDMIDVTGSIVGSLGHSYEDPAFIADLRALIYQDSPPGVGARAHLDRRQVRSGLFRNLATLNYFQLRH
ncbi:MAG TPA: alpha/beta hydrolase [Chthoniobacterales bacterium]|nr:alpha/beta hydrolase [Chthoniobacterales bacterium]